MRTASVERTPRQTCARWAVGAVLGYTLFLGIFLGGAGRGDPAWFIHLGSQRIPVKLARKVLGKDVVVPHLDGHDGRFFWVQARDPLLLHPHEVAANLDRPAYRAQRVLYPLLAAPWRVFGEYGVVWALVLTNLGVVAIGAWFATALALDLRLPPRVGLAFTLNPVTVIAVTFDTADALALVGVVAGLWCIRRHSWAGAVVAASVATLAKEPTILAFAAFAVIDREIPRRARAAIVAVPAMMAGLWALYERSRLGWPPSAIEEFTAPLYGYLDAYRRGWHRVGNWSDAVVAVGVLLIAILVVARWVKRRTVVLAGAVPFALMVPFFSAQVLDLADNSLRALGPAVTLLALDVYQALLPRRPAGLEPPPSSVDVSP